ncbi:MAG: TetR/AcrR family transcriptional regulator [Clostridiaceae bacterium]|nr:TetR/AcrR family transcriptional regulator [Clostridiaceae bacterium]MDE7036339.1 TetR/AcrR family transcriptional regulator [Eubacteriales bacterium]
MASDARSRRREEILQAAFVEFCEKGYDRAKIEEIAHRAGIGKSTVYEYFPSKAELLTATGDFVLGQIFQDVESLLSTDRPVRQALADYLEYVSSMMGSIGASFLHIVGDMSVTQIVHNLCKRYLVTITACLERVLQAAQDRGEISTDINVRTASQMIVTMPNPPFVRLVRQDHLRDSIERLVDLLFAGLAPR